MKRTISMLLSISLLFSFVSLGAFAYEPYVNDEIIKLLPITYVDFDSGEEITSITANTNVKAKTFVKAGENIIPGQSVTLIMSVYSSNVLVSYDEASVLVPEIGSKELSCAVSIPNEENLSLKTFVWDNLTNSRPLASAAIFGENNAQVNEIIIDGTPLKNFSADINEYDYTISAAHINFPEVSVVTANSAAKTNIVIDGNINDEHSRATINVTSPDGKVKNSYVINYTKEKAAVTNAKLNLPGKSPVALTTGIVAEPEWDEDKKPAVIPTVYGYNKTDNSAFFETNLPAIRTTMYTDRNWYYMNISPEFIGGISIITPYGTKDSDEAADPSINDLITFDINRSATIYIHINGATWPQLANAGFTYDLLQPKGDRMMQYSNNYSFQPTYFYDKDVDVAPGETATVSLPYITKGTMYCIIVKFKENVMITNPTLENYQSVKRNILVNNSLFEPKYYNEELGVSLEGNYFTNIRNYTRAFQNLKVPGLYNFDEEFLGGNLLILPVNINPNGNTNKTLEFDLSSSCEVLIIWNNASTNETIVDYCNKNGWIETDSELMFCHASSNANVQDSGVAFKKVFYVRPGDTEHVKLVDFPASSNQFIVMARPIDIN